MIVLDTNVISEALRRDPDAVVLDWLNRQIASTLHVSTVTVAELLLGVELLDAGRRKDALRAAAVLAERVAIVRSQGRAVSLADGQIAATAMSRGFEVATRDTGPFVAVGADVVDPWTVD